MSRAPLNLETPVRQKPDLVATEMADITVMFRVEQERYYGFEAVGSRIWQLLETPTTVAALCGRLQGEFDVPPDQCVREALAFVQQLYDEDLVVVSNAPDR